MPKIKTFIQLKYIKRLKEIYLPKKIKPFSRKHCPVLIKSFLDLPPNFCFSKIEGNKSIDSNWIFKGQKKTNLRERRDLRQRMTTRWRQHASLKPSSHSSVPCFSFAIQSFINGFMASIERERERERELKEFRILRQPGGAFVLSFECLTLWLINKLPGAGGSDKITAEFTDLSKI